MRWRCRWVGADPLMIAYHDEEWGVPQHTDDVLFEFLVLEGSQAGLSWRTVLQKRPAYRTHFAGFDPRVVAAFDDGRVDALCREPGLIRHRGKITAAVANARAFLLVQEEFGSFDRYLWGFVGGTPRVRSRTDQAPPAAETDLSRALSRDLRRRGFRFVGPIICQSYLEAVGVLMDHDPTCFRYRDLTPRPARLPP